MKHICTRICEIYFRACTKCNQQYFLTEYHRDDKSKDGHVSQCKLCVSLRLKQYYQENAEKVLNRVKIYSKSHKEEIAAYNRQWVQDNKDIHNEHNRKWRAENKDYCNEYHRKYYEENTEKVYLANKKWRQNNPEKARLYVENRRARELHAEGSYTLEEWLEVCINQEYKCFDCHKERPLTVGHMIPLSKGGSNKIDNIIAQCQSCNSKQGTQIHVYVDKKNIK